MKKKNEITESKNEITESKNEKMSDTKSAKNEKEVRLLDFDKKTKKSKISGSGYGGDSSETNDRSNIINKAGPHLSLIPEVDESQKKIKSISTFPNL